MSLKQNILKSFNEAFPDSNEKIIRARRDIVNIFIESRLSIIEQEVRKCVPEEIVEIESYPHDSQMLSEGHNDCRKTILEALDKLFNE